MAIYFDDVSVGDEDRFGAYRVSKDEVVGFAAQYDPQPFHLNAEAARDSIFGRIAASGWHTAAISMRMLVDRHRETGQAMIAGLGVDALRWPRPVYPGDALSCRTIVVDMRATRSNPNAGIIEIAMQVFNQEETEVCTYRSRAMFARRPG